MPLLILILILGIPVLELMVMIEIGSNIGAFSTVALTILTAIIGLQLVRAQGLRVVTEMQAAAAAGQPVGDKMVHGFFLAIAGLFLFFPGFITDFIGALLLIAPVRQLLGRFVVTRLVKNARSGSLHRGSASHDSETTVIYTSIETDDTSVETEFWSEDDKSDTKD